MGLANDIRKKMDKKRKELQERNSSKRQLQASLRETYTQIRELIAAITAYEEVLKIAPEDDAEDGKSEPRAGSAVALARDALRQHGQPMHVSKLLDALGRQPTHEQRVSLSSSLAAYVRKGQIFTRPEANTFGLLEWQQPASTATEENPSEKDVTEVLEKVR